MTKLLLEQNIKRKPVFPAVLRRSKKLWLLAAVLAFLSGVILLETNAASGRSVHASAGIEFPAGPGIETVLSDYLLTEPIQEGRGQSLHPEILRNLKVGIYTVKKGDTLSAIAQVFGLNMDTIISFNGIKNSRKLLAGAKLDIPNADGLRYAVKRGDSLEKIARSYDVSLREMAKWNSLESDVIVPGQLLFIPGARLSTNELNLVLGKLFVYPAKGRLTSPFGYRTSPITGMREFHQGIDIAGPTGTPIRASMAGRVAAVGVAPIWGKYVILRHADGYQTLYGHLNVIKVSRGTWVEQGGEIGDMGNTGFSTGSHLHFTIFKNGAPVDPLTYLP